MKKKNIILIILLVCYLLLTVLVIKGKFENIDISVFNFFIKFKCSLVTVILYIITNVASTLFISLILIVLLMIFYKKEKLKYYAFIFLNTILGPILMKFIKEIIKRPRPSWQWLKQKGYSYPSGHTLTSFLLFMSLVLVLNKLNIKNKVLKIVLLSFVLLVGISRIYFGVHFFSDVLASILIGSIVIIISYQIFNRGFNYENKNR